MATFLTARRIGRLLGICCLLTLVGMGFGLIAIHALAEYHLRQARIALERQGYNDALMELETALRFRPRSADIHLLAGRTARQAGKYPLAWDHLYRCRNLQGGVSGELQLEEYLLRAQTGGLEEVFPFLLPHLAQDDAQTPLVLETLSQAYLFLYRFDNAGQCLERWLHLQPDNVQALYLRGTYYSLLGKRELAMTELRSVVEHDPNRLAARLLLAQLLTETFHLEEAVAEYETALRQEPMNLKARLGLASCYVRQGEWAQAETMLQECPPDSEADAEYAHLRGRVAEGRKHYAEAVPFYQAALAARPADDAACYHLILCYERLGDEVSATQYRELHDRIKKDQVRLLAITKDEKEFLPSDPGLCCELGEICLRLGIKQRGLHWLQAALFLDPRHRRAHEQLLRYYERLGPEGEEDAAFHRRMLGQLAGSVTTLRESTPRQP